MQEAVAAEISDLMSSLGGLILGQSIALQVGILERDPAVPQLVEIDAVTVERLAGVIDAGDPEGTEQLVAGAMDARLREARLAMRAALVGEVRAQRLLALEHAAGRRAAGIEAPFEVFGHAGRDLLDIGLVECPAEAAEQIVDRVGH